MNQLVTARIARAVSDLPAAEWDALTDEIGRAHV